jgi:peptidoglycan-associated lipoprotein
MRRPRLLAAAFALALGLAACSTQGDSSEGTTGSGGTAGSGGTVQRSGGVEQRGADGLRRALGEQGVGDRVLFAYDSSELNPEARRQVERWAQLLRQYPGVRTTIEGHCDERGTREYNLALGERRAAAVKTYLVSLGVPAAQLETISYGKEKPAVLGSTDASWAQNRRGVLVVE